MRKLEDIKRSIEEYSDIIDMDPPVSLKYPKMPKESRAKEFAPFDALTGFTDLIKENGNILQEKILLDEAIQNRLDARFNILLKNIDLKPLVSITYFLSKKNTEGNYVIANGYVKKIDLIKRVIILKEGTIINFDNIIDIKSKIFDE